MREYHFYIYILTNKINTCFYIGVTNNLINRISQHKNKKNINSFTARYNINKLVYYEEYQYIQDAIQREKELKGWKQYKKIELIKSKNNSFIDIGKDF